jgi:hypothetical protein
MCVEWIGAHQAGILDHERDLLDGQRVRQIGGIEGKDGAVLSVRCIVTKVEGGGCTVR